MDFVFTENAYIWVVIAQFVSMGLTGTVWKEFCAAADDAGEGIDSLGN